MSFNVYKIYTNNVLYKISNGPKLLTMF